MRTKQPTGVEIRSRIQKEEIDATLNQQEEKIDNDIYLKYLGKQHTVFRMFLGFSVNIMNVMQVAWLNWNYYFD